MSDEEMDGWYPPRRKNQTSEEIAINRVTEFLTSHGELPTLDLPDREQTYEERAEIFSSLGVEWLTHNDWSDIPSAERKETCRRMIQGVSVKSLPADHPLGRGETPQYGLFATRYFDMGEILGEYTGQVVGKNVSGPYVAVLEDKKTFAECHGVNAVTRGNELRFINSYLGIAFRPNTCLKVAYLADGEPHILIMTTTAIDVGDEILLDYGDAYDRAYILPKSTEEESVN